MSKKIIRASVFAAMASLAALGLTSCDDLLVEIEEARAEIKICVPKEEREVIDKALKQANQSLKNKYVYTFEDMSEADAGDELKNYADEADTADLFLIADDQLEGLKKANAIAPLSSENKAWVVENNTKGSVDAITTGNDTYGYPVSLDNGYFLWYDQSYISAEEAGSFEAILARCQVEGKSFAMHLDNGFYANSFIMSPQACGPTSLLWSSVTGSNVYTTTWDKGEGPKVSEYISNLIRPYVENGTFKNEDNDAITADLENGSVIATILGTWEETAFVNALTKVRVQAGETKGTPAAAKLPEYHIDGKAYQMASFKGAKLFVVNEKKSDLAKKTAHAIAKIISNESTQILRNTDRHIIPCNKKAINKVELSIGGQALTAQAEFGATQSRVAENRYWTIGAAIGLAYVNGLSDGQTWTQFLTEQMDILRNPAVQ